MRFACENKGAEENGWGNEGQTVDDQVDALPGGSGINLGQKLHKKQLSCAEEFAQRDQKAKGNDRGHQNAGMSDGADNFVKLSADA